MLRLTTPCYSQWTTIGFIALLFKTLLREKCKLSMIFAAYIVPYSSWLYMIPLVLKHFSGKAHSSFVELLYPFVCRSFLRFEDQSRIFTNVQFEINIWYYNIKKICEFCNASTSFSILYIWTSYMHICSKYLAHRLSPKFHLFFLSNKWIEPTWVSHLLKATFLAESSPEGNRNFPPPRLVYGCDIFVRTSCIMYYLPC